MNDEVIEIKGTILGDIGKRIDKNGYDFYYGKLNCDDGAQQTFFFFRPAYDLEMRIGDLKGGENITLKGSWGKRQPVIFVATDFVLEDESGWSF
jgi:hypothetical protein